MFNERERPVLPAQFAMRVAILSGIALVMFSIIFFRLWYLQVLSSDHYLKLAQNNQVRDVTVQAPRGEILDRNGKVLVDNRTALALQILPTELPQKRQKQREEFARLSHVINMPTDRIEKQIRQQTKDLPSNPVTLRRDVSYDLVYYLRENQDKYPGVTVQRVYVRNYPDGSLAAQIYGYVREVTKQQLTEARYQGLQPGDQVGQSGIENTYDNVLRGTNGMTRVQVDAAGNPTGHILNQVQPKPGDNLVLSLDRPVQQAGEQAINSFSTPGAFVAMNVKNGQILGLGSSPTFDPAVFSKPVIPTSVYKQLTSQTTYAPLTNRAIQGLYPTGSTFKPITAIAALESGTITPSTTIVDGGSFNLGDGTTLQNAGGASYGALQLTQALQVSSDVFFYNVGADLYKTGNTSAQDKWAYDLGIGHPTGIDLPGEVAGLLPTPQWRDQLYKEAQSPNSPGGTSVVPGDPTDRPWTLGDNVNLAVGQGDLQADPLQMAVAYAAIGNGGDVVRPHVAKEVEDPNGSVVQEIDPAPIRHLDINPSYRSAIMQGIHEAAQSPGGTSYPVFGNFPIPMAGKTGTAQRPGYQDQSWYVCMAPYPNPKIVVAATIEQGGFGVQAAAPVARQILTAYYDEHPAEAKKAGGKPPKQTPISTTAPVVGNPY
jgi:penicillin-binding protein 2